MRWFSTLTLYAGCLLFLVNSAAAEPITGHTTDVVFVSSTTVSVAEGSVGEEASSIGEVPGSPLYSELFQFKNGVGHRFILTYEPGTPAGVVVFAIDKSDAVNMGITAPFDSILVRTNSLLPDANIEVTSLILGPPPSAGGGGTLVHEFPPIGGPLAASRAFGSGVNLDVLKISGVDLSVGFTFQGQVVASYSAEEAEPTGDELLFQIYLSQAPEFPDDDGDGVENSVDNCRNKSNPPDVQTGQQANSDGDSLGDACDNCPTDTNEPDGEGNQVDGDGDGWGDVCDNCDDDCTRVSPETGTCSNKSQLDSESFPGPDGEPGIAGFDDDGENGIDDPGEQCPLNSFGLHAPIGESDDICGDGIGNRCDNCIQVVNPDQFDFNRDPDADRYESGDACIVSTVRFSSSFVPDPPLALPEGSAAVTAEEVPTPQAPGLTSVGLTLDCGARNISAANIGLLLPIDPDDATEAALVDFGGCTAPGPAPNDDNQFLCNTALHVSEGGSLGNTVAKVGSSTIGTHITSAEPDVAPQLVIVQLVGNMGTDGLLCRAFGPGVPADETNVFLGTITASNLSENAVLLPTTAGFDQFPSPKQMLTEVVDGAPVEVPAPAIATASGPSNPIVALAVNPNIDDLFGFTRFVVTMSTDSSLFGGVDDDVFVHRIALGIQVRADVEPTEVQFGNCDTDDTVEGFPVKTCNQTGTNTYLGPGVSDDASDTFVIQPNLDPATLPLGVTLPADTMFVVLTGDFDNPVSFDELSVNNSDATVELGVIEYLIAGDPPQTLPGLTFGGTEKLADFTDGPILIAGEGDPISGSSAGIESGGNASTDNDGDGRGDNADNCLNWPNFNQQNNGGVGEEGQGVDEIGDLCQCGDSLGDGTVDNGTATSESTQEDDVTACQVALAQANTPPPPGETEEQRTARLESAARCAVTGGETPTIVDLVVMELELELEGAAGTPIEQVCDQANE
jgi:hypothetical protein